MGMRSRDRLAIRQTVGGRWEVAIAIHDPQPEVEIAGIYVVRAMRADDAPRTHRQDMMTVVPSDRCHAAWDQLLAAARAQPGQWTRWDDGRIASGLPAGEWAAAANTRYL